MSLNELTKVENLNSDWSNYYCNSLATNNAIIDNLTILGSITGISGIQGMTGDQGITGEQGITGPQGAPGVSGSPISSPNPFVFNTNVQVNGPSSFIGVSNNQNNFTAFVNDNSNHTVGGAEVALFFGDIVKQNNITYNGSHGYVVSNPGLYLVTANITVANVVNVETLQININSNIAYRTSAPVVSVDGVTQVLSISGIVNLDTNDIIAIIIYQGSGANSAVQGSLQHNSLTSALYISMLTQ